MALIKLQVGLGNLGVLTDNFNGGPFALDFSTQTPVEFQLDDLSSFSGGHLLAYGTGFTYQNDRPVTGDIRLVTFAGLNSLLTVQDLTLKATDLAAATKAAGHSILKVLALMNGGNDSVVGTDLSDNITSMAGAGKDTVHGGFGDDIINGGTGKDRIYGDVGNDTLAGGIGADAFVFATGFGDDTVSDFHHTGTVTTDDHLWVTHQMYRGMTITQTVDTISLVTSTHLHFGVQDEIVLTGWHAADVNGSFFHLYV